MKIAFLGDIAFVDKYDLINNPNAKNNLKEIAEYLKKYDYVIGNLESPLTDRKHTLVCKSMHLRSNSINVQLLKYLNISAVSLANNHTNDFGKQGLEDTIQILKKNNIEYFGVNNKYILKEGIRIHGYCCYSTNATGYSNRNSKYGINPLHRDSIFNEVEKDREKGLLSLLAIHWGDEHTNYPRYDHIQFIKKLKTKNNIVVSGHHPHVVQGIDDSENSLIAYSQGNFCFDDLKAISGTGLELKQNEENRESFILEVLVEKNKVKDYKVIGIREIKGEIKLSSIQKKLKLISKELRNIINPDEYQNKRINQYSNKEFRIRKFGKKDFNWYCRRLNYYSIGALLIAKINSIKYSRYFLKN